MLISYLCFYQQSNMEKITVFKATTSLNLPCIFIINLTVIISPQVGCRMPNVLSSIYVCYVYVFYVVYVLN